MGFLNFLKKRKEEHIDESLDIPPMPPPIKETKEELPELHKFEFEENLPEDFPTFKFREEKPAKHPLFEEKLFELPKNPEFEIPPTEEKPSFIPKPPLMPMPSLKESIREVPLQKTELKSPIKPEKPFYEKIEKRAVREERKILKERAVSKPLYIKIDRFKETLKNISIIRIDLKKSDEILLNLIKPKEDKGEEFEKWRAVMEDMQKKLIFIEKTLFKGD